MPDRRPKGVFASSPADIWTIEMTIGEIMTNGDMATKEKQWAFNKRVNAIPQVTGDALKHFPKALVDLVHRCIVRLPKNRIGIEELCERIEKEARDLRRTPLTAHERVRFPWENKVAWMMAK